MLGTCKEFVALSFYNTDFARLLLAALRRHKFSKRLFWLVVPSQVVFISQQQFLVLPRSLGITLTVLCRLAWWRSILNLHKIYRMEPPQVQANGKIQNKCKSSIVIVGRLAKLPKTGIISQIEENTSSDREGYDLSIEIRDDGCLPTIAPELVGHSFVFFIAPPFFHLGCSLHRSYLISNLNGVAIEPTCHSPVTLLSLSCHFSVTPLSLPCHSPVTPLSTIFSSPVNC